MSRHWTLLPLMLLLGSTATLPAQALDSPDVVYIDGQPCSRACQAYMNWTNRALAARRHEQREIIVVVPPEAEFERVEPVVRPRAAKHAAPVARNAPQAAKTASNGNAPGVNISGAKVSNGKKVTAPNAAPAATPKVTPNALPPLVAAATPAKPVEETTAAIQKPGPKVESAKPPEPAQTVAVAPPQPAAAPAPKEKASTPPAPEVKTEAKAEVAIEKKPEVALPPPATLEVAAAPAAPAMAPGKAREIAKDASASLDDPDNLVALVLAGPEINSLSDLNNKNIAITEKQSASSGRVSAALMAAGAAEVQFSEAKSSAIDRLMNGEVPAAVVLAPRDVANLFPEVEGFRTFRVPLKAKM
jgi:hypothetical protein